MSEPDSSAAAAPSRDHTRHSIWRPRRHRGAAARRSLWRRRLLMTFIGLALCVGLGILLDAPFRHPNLQIAILPTLPAEDSPTFGDGGPAHVLPLFAGEDRTAVERLAPATPTGSVIELPVPSSAGDFESLPNLLKADGDVLIVFLQTQAMSIDDRPGFECALGGLRSDDNFVPLSALLRILTERAGANRSALLLVIDQGAAARADVNTFPALVAETVRATHNPHLWVLCSNSLLENSELLWSRRRSVFADAVARGLAGDADLDGDRDIDLFELARFVGNQVSDTVHSLSRGQASQTPFLCWGGGEIPSMDPPVLAPALSSELADAAAGPLESPFSGVTGTGQSEEAIAATQPAEPATDKAGGGDETTATDSTPDADVISPADKLAELVVRAWQLRDELESGPLSPIAYAPHEWLQFTSALQRVEALVWADAGTTSLVLELEDVLAALSAAMNGADAPRPVPRTMQPLVDAIRTRVALASVDTKCLVFAMRLGASLPEETTTAWERYTAALEAEDSTALTTWLADAAPELFTWDEFAMARTLAPELSDDWHLLSRVLKVHSAAEQAALLSDPAAMYREPMRSADSARVAAEELLTDAVNPDRVLRAGRLLDEAERGYAEARRAAEILAAVRASHMRQSFLASEYCRWWTHNGPVASRFGPAEGDLHDLIDELSELSPILHDAAPGDRARLQSGLENLRFLSERICADVCAHEMSPGHGRGAGPATSWQIQALLGTTLPGGTDRLALLQSITTAEQSAISSMRQPELTWPLPRRSLSVTDWLFLVSKARLSAELVALAAVEVPGVDDQVAGLRAAVDELGSPQLIEGGRVSDGLALGQHREFTTRLGRTAASVSAAAAASHLPVSTGTLTDIDRALAAAERSLQCARVLGGRDIRPMGSAPANLSRLHMADRLAWLAERLETGTRDLDAAVAGRRLAAADACRRRSRELLGIGASATVATPSIQIDAPAAIELYEPDRRLEFSVSASTSGEEPAWLVLDYDPRLLSVSGPPGLLVYRQPVLAESKGTTSPPAAVTQLQQLMEEQPRSLLLGRGANRVELDVRRLATADHPTRLIVKVGGREGWVRETVTIDLPTPDFAAVEVAGRDGSWEQDEAGIILHPFPNQPTEYQLRLRNLTEESRTVDVRLLALSAAIPVSLPPGVVTAESASEILSRIPGLRTAGSLMNQQLPPLSGPLGSDAPPEEPPEPPPLTSLQYGGVLAIVDRESGQTALKMVQVQPQHPRRYLRPEVSYDLERERVQIVVRAEDPALLPGGGSGINAEFSVPLEDARQLDGALRPGREEARLFAEIPSAPGKVVELRLHVDGYPRAFLYQVPCDRPVSFVPESLDVPRIRVVAPAPGTAFQTPTAAISASLRIDAPEGAFRNPGTLAEIGFDLNRDRFLIDEPTVRLLSDRSVTIAAQPLTPAGRLVLDTTVTDYRLSLPATGLRTARVNLQGRLQVENDTSWSQPVEIVFDATPPTIDDVVLQPGRIVAATDTLEVTVSVDDGDGSGTGRVELAFDTARTGEFTDDSAVVQAARRPSGEWSAELPLAELPPGGHGLLIRAVDRTNNVSDARRESLTVLSEEDAETRRITLTAPVIGSARYGDRPVPNASVTLVDAEGNEAAATRSNGAGQFQLPKVAPGEYTLTADGLVRNKVRHAEASVTVPPAPGVVEAIPLQLR